MGNDVAQVNESRRPKSIPRSIIRNLLPDHTIV